MSAKNNTSKSKILDITTATSIILPREIADNNEELIIVASNRDNIFYHVNNSNTVIMRVEEDFCILVDYKVDTYKDNDVCLPKMLSAAHYGVYQLKGRDWVKQTNGNNRIIGYDIKELIHGGGYKLVSSTLDHKFETYDEREKAKEFSECNYNKGSHRRKIVISNMNELNALIQRIQENENEEGGLYW